MRALLSVRPEPVAIAAAAVSSLLIVAAFAASLGSTAVPAGSLAAAGAFLLIVAIGLSLYAWRLGASGRSD